MGYGLWSVGYWLLAIGYWLRSKLNGLVSILGVRFVLGAAHSP